MHLNGNIFEKFYFLKTVEVNVIIITGYVDPNETITINKFQRSRLTFQHSYWFLLIYLNTFSQKSFGQLKSN